MSGRVSTDDLMNAQIALEHEADTYEASDDLAESLRRVAEWLDRERQRRYLRAAKRSMPDVLGFRQVSGGVQQ